MKSVKVLIGKIYLKMIDAINTIAYYLSGVHFENQRKLKSLKDIYKGKAFFVVCNGPSLQPSDLTDISKAGFISIGMNHIARIYDSTPWRVNVLIVTDNTCYYGKHTQLIRECQAQYKVFRRNQFLKSIGFKGEKLYVSIDGSRTLLDYPKFSEDLSRIVYAIGTTAYESIEWARYLGASNIYLIGCDMSYAVNANRDGSLYYNNSGKSHFYGNQEIDISKVVPIQTWEQKAAHKAADSYSRKHGFRIFNATRGGCLEEYERVNIDKLLESIK